MCAVALKRRTNCAVVAAVFGAKRAPFPAFIDPCDPTLRNRAPDGPGWLHEIKIDGYRAQLHIHRGRVTIYSRSGYDWTEQFRQIAHATARLSAHELIIDGEATVYGSTGLPDFQALRRELAKKHSDRLVYLAFDLLYLDGYDLRGAPLIERKRVLQCVLEKPPPKIVYVEHFEMDDGEAVYRHACKLKLEGIVSKRRDSRYRSGRQDSWLKLKCTKSDTFPIIAFVEKLGARPRKIASLYVGRCEGDRLLYAGKARSGYTEAIAREVRERLDPLIVRRALVGSRQETESHLGQAGRPSRDRVWRYHRRWPSARGGFQGPARRSSPRGGTAACAEPGASRRQGTWRSAVREHLAAAARYGRAQQRRTCRLLA
jgi:bifunctional non-homologous end joining protein LigD